MSISYNQLWNTEAISYAAYREIMAEQVAAGETSGPMHSENLINFTALNERRMLRLDRKAALLPMVAVRMRAVVQPQHWLVITETWCGDAAQILPILKKMAEQSEAIEMKLIWRDAFPDLMNAHLSNGARAIPKLIALNEAGEVMGEWGPRPREAQQLLINNKGVMAKLKTEEERVARYGEFQIELQKWYNDDKGERTQLEMLVEVERWQD